MPRQGHHRPGVKPLANRGAPVAAMLLPLMLSLLSPVAIAPVAEAQEEDSGSSPEDIWSVEYANQIFPWGPHGDSDQLQFRSYHDYFSLKQRMQTLAAYYPDFLQFHEGLLGGINARGDPMTSD